MRDVIWVSDFFYPEVKGGAESCDRVALDELQKRGRLKKKIYSDNLKQGHINSWGDCLFVVSNFAKMNGQQKILMNNDVDYVIMEHDYKFEEMRQPQRHPDYVVPEECMRNKKFYQYADLVIVQTELQKGIFEKNLDDVEFCKLAGSLWMDEDLDFLLSQSGDGEGTAIVDNDNPIKGRDLAIQYCEKNDIEFDLISSPDQREFWKKMSEYERLVYLPLTPETFARTAVEAKILGLSVVANKKVGASYEEWFDWQPEEIMDLLKSKKDELIEIFGEI